MSHHEPPQSTSDDKKSPPAHDAPARQEAGLGDVIQALRPGSARRDGPLDPATIRRVSSLVGNRAVMRLLAARTARQPPVVSPATAPKPMLQAKGIAIQQAAPPGAIQRAFVDTLTHGTVEALAALDIGQEVATFGGGGPVHGEIVTAQQGIVDGEKKATAAHTIAMFNYMDRHAAGLAGAIAADFQTIDEKDRDQHLQDLATKMFPKVGDRGLWTGSEERGLIALGALDAQTYFQNGKAQLLAKAGQVPGRVRVLLENHSHNMDAKSYGRRAESMQQIDTASLPGGAAVAPQANVANAYNQPGWTFYDGLYTPVAPAALADGEVYTLHIQDVGTYQVTVLVNNVAGQTVTFSAVEQ